MSKKVDKNQHIHVYVRCRPQNAFEKKANSQIVVETNQENREVIVKERLCDKDFSKKFTFDRVFGPDNTQLDLYKTVASPCVEEVLLGYNCTVFAYGQTGTGKTYTMQGTRTETNSWEEDPDAGIVPRALHHLFDELKLRFPEFTIRVSFLELYNEELFDLLGSMAEGNKLRLYDDITRKGSVVIQGLTEIAVHTKEELYYIMELGTNRRKTASTLMNTDSSRSHTIFSITVHIRECTLEGEELLKTGKLNLVDLAGSECVGRSGAVDRRAREAGNINQSLLTLGRVITALVEKTPHIPYRESKLTRLLQDSLGGRTKTSIIATVSPAQCNLEETLSTLDYAHRAKNITNKPEINQRMTKKMLIREYAEEIAKLRKDLVASRDKHGIYVDVENYNLMKEKLKTQKDEMEEKEDRVLALAQELEMLKQMFSDSQKDLAEKEEALCQNKQELTKTSKLLDVTCKTLSKTSCERDEQQHLVHRHTKTEKSLLAQAQKLQTVVVKSSSDAEALHKKLLRKKHAEEINKQHSQSFQSRLEDSMAEFFHLVHTNTCAQEQEFNSTLAFLDSEFAELQDHSQQLEEIFTALQSSHEENVSTQKEALAQRKEKLEAWTEDQLSQSSQYLMVTSDREKQYLTQFNAPVYCQINTLLEKQDKVMEKEKEKLTSVLQDEMKTIETSRCQIFDAVSELKSGVQYLLEPKTANISQCQDTLQKVSTSEESLFQNISSINTELGKFVAFTTSAKEEINNRLNQINNDVSQVSSKLDDISESNSTLSSLMQSSMLKIQADADELLTKCASNTSQLETETLDCINKNKDLSETLCKSLICLEDGVAFHSSNVQKELENQQALVAEAIHHIEDQSKIIFPEDKSDMDGLGEIVKDAAELHKEMVRKHLGMRVNHASELKNKIDHSSQATRDLAESVNKFLLQQDKQLACFLHEDLLKDIPTGQTPQRTEYSFPRTLAATSPHDKILREFRANQLVETAQKHMEAAQNLPLPDPDTDDFDKRSGHNTSFSSTLSDDGSVDSRDSARSMGKENWKKPKSCKHLPTPVRTVSAQTSEQPPLGVNNSPLIKFE